MILHRVIKNQRDPLLTQVVGNPILHLKCYYFQIDLNPTNCLTFELFDLQETQ